MSIQVTEKEAGKYADGREIKKYTIVNANGMEAVISNLGGAITNLYVPDASGNKADVVLGFDEMDCYMENGSFFGIVVGPSANRIGGASFEIDGQTYQVAVNDGKNNLHSDMQKGYHKCLWDATILENGVRLALKDSDGNMGFPGNKEITVEYTLDDENALSIHYHGVSDKKTILNLTNHTYFNLDGHDSGSIVDHELWLGASHYTPVVAGCIPTGEIAAVAGTPMDFTTAKRIGNEISDKFEQLEFGTGYDHNWVIDGWKNDGAMIHFATVKAPKSKRVMKAYTNLPGVQFYAGNCISKVTGKNGAVYTPRTGLCLETQYYPDTIHHDNFPSCVFGEGKDYDSVTVYKFEN